MTTFLLILLVIAIATAAFFFFQKQKMERILASERERALAEINWRGTEATTAAAKSQSELERKSVEFDAEAQRVRNHYETESRKIIEEIHTELVNARAELEPLRTLSGLQQSESEVRATLSNALAEADALRAEAQALVEQSRQAATEERRQGQHRAQELFKQAEALLVQATRDAGKIVTAAETKAQQIGGDAYTALQEKQMLQQAIKAIHNVIEGYGDRYIIPTHSLLDELASDFGHTAAGEALRAAREQSRRRGSNRGGRLSRERRRNAITRRLTAARPRSAS